MNVNRNDIIKDVSEISAYVKLIRKLIFFVMITLKYITNYFFPYTIMYWYSFECPCTRIIDAIHFILNKYVMANSITYINHMAIRSYLREIAYGQTENKKLNKLNFFSITLKSDSAQLNWFHWAYRQFSLILHYTLHS